MGFFPPLTVYVAVPGSAGTDKVLTVDQCCTIIPDYCQLWTCTESSNSWKC